MSYPQAYLEPSRTYTIERFSDEAVLLKPQWGQKWIGFIGFGKDLYFRNVAS